MKSKSILIVLLFFVCASVFASTNNDKTLDKIINALGGQRVSSC